MYVKIHFPKFLCLSNMTASVKLDENLVPSLIAFRAVRLLIESTFFGVGLALACDNQAA